MRVSPKYGKKLRVISGLVNSDFESLKKLIDWSLEWDRAHRPSKWAWVAHGMSKWLWGPLAVCGWNIIDDIRVG